MIGLGTACFSAWLIVSLLFFFWHSFSLLIKGRILYRLSRRELSGRGRDISYWIWRRLPLSGASMAQAPWLWPINRRIKEEHPRAGFCPLQQCRPGPRGGGDEISARKSLPLYE